MKPILLTDYGIENPIVAVSNGVTEIIKPKRDAQTYLIDAPFECPISKDVWKSRILHDARCQYKYCKKGWNFDMYI